MWTKRALKDNFVALRFGDYYMHEMLNGNYLATGEDIYGKRIERRYIVNDTKDSQSKWAMWHDFAGRWGLTRLYYIADNGKRILLWRA
jgi:hypothetical protein